MNFNVFNGEKNIKKLNEVRIAEGIFLISGISGISGSYVCCSLKKKHYYIAIVFTRKYLLIILNLLLISIFLIIIICVKPKTNEKNWEITVLLTVLKEN